MRRLSLAAFLSGTMTLLAAVPPAYAGASYHVLQSGLYEVAVTLDMGAMEDLNARKTVRICIRDDDAGGSRGLFLLSDNVQLAHCPVKNMQEAGTKLTFEIICEGIDAGRVSASYALEPQAFEGRLSMRMGGKNMTMRESQSGHRVGECPQ